MELRPDLKAIMPPRMRRLPIDEHGRPLPWFLQRDALPALATMRRHLQADPLKIVRAVRANRCLMCGAGLGKALGFVLRPAATLTRLTSEPASHPECAKFAARAGIVAAPGDDAVAVWLCNDAFVQAAQGSPLITVGDPRSVQFWRAGKLMDHAAALEAIAAGLQKLRADCAALGLPAPEPALMAARLDEVKFYLPDAEVAA